MQAPILLRQRRQWQELLKSSWQEMHIILENYMKSRQSEMTNEKIEAEEYPEGKSDVVWNSGDRSACIYYAVYRNLSVRKYEKEMEVSREERQEKRI